MPADASALPPTPLELTRHFSKRYREQLAIAALAVVAACMPSAPLSWRSNPASPRIEPYYMPAITAAHKEGLKSDAIRKFLCYCCPECCRGRPPEDPRHLPARRRRSSRATTRFPPRGLRRAPGRREDERISRAPEITFFQNFGVLPAVPPRHLARVAECINARATPDVPSCNLRLGRRRRRRDHGRVSGGGGAAAERGEERAAAHLETGSSAFSGALVDDGGLTRLLI